MYRLVTAKRYGPPLSTPGSLGPPRKLHLEITVECNLRCKQCHMWMLKESPQRLSTEEKLGVVTQFGAMNPAGIVILTGGETMSKLEEFFAITRLCRKLGLTTVANSNSTHINEDNLERTLVEGPNYLFLSLDSHQEEIHDYIRGVKGNYRQVVDTARKLVALKRGKYPNCGSFIMTNSVIFDRNVEHWLDYIEWARRELRVDGVQFQLLSRTFRNQNGKKDPFFERHFIRDVARAQAIISRILERYSNDSFMGVGQVDLKWMQLYVANPDFIGEQVCGAHEKNIIVDERGDVQLCFNMKSDITGGVALGNVRQDTLKDLWTRDFTRQVRQTMSSCRLNCGMLSCHRKDRADVGRS